jgi:hypothetical protein
MMRLACSLVLSTSLAISGFAESPQAIQETKDKQPPPKTETASLKQPLAFGLEDGTPIKLRLTGHDCLLLTSKADWKKPDVAMQECPAQ